MLKSNSDSIQWYKIYVCAVTNDWVFILLKKSVESALYQVWVILGLANFNLPTSSTCPPSLSMHKSQRRCMSWTARYCNWAQLCNYQTPPEVDLELLHSGVAGAPSSVLHGICWLQKPSALLLAAPFWLHEVSRHMKSMFYLLLRHLKFKEGHNGRSSKCSYITRQLKEDFIKIASQVTLYPLWITQEGLPQTMNDDQGARISLTIYHEYD